MAQAELFTTYTEVKREWIDYNGHMNMGYYMIAFDYIATDQFYDSMNIGVAQKQALGKTTFTLGANINFIREVMYNRPAVEVCRLGLA
jgi:acyl-CoA thioester hydrolase